MYPLHIPCDSNRKSNQTQYISFHLNAFSLLFAINLLLFMRPSLLLPYGGNFQSSKVPPFRRKGYTRYKNNKKPPTFDTRCCCLLALSLSLLLLFFVYGGGGGGLPTSPLHTGYCRLL